MNRCRAGLLLLLAPVAAQAEQWTLENTLATRYEANDNTALAATPLGTMNTLSVSSNLQASRRSENAATGVRAAMAAVRERGPGAGQRVDGAWGVSQSFEAPLHSLNLSANYLRDFNNQVETSDVLVGRARRKSLQASGQLSRVLNPTWTANVQASTDRTGYEGTGSSTNYRNSTAGGGLSYRHTELQTWSVNLSSSRYRTESGAYGSDTEQLSVGWSQVVTERSNVSLSVGGYRSRAEGLRFALVCPLDPSFCVTNTGYYTLISEPVWETKRGLQFNLSGKWQLDEVSDLVFNATREQAPSGAGVVAQRDRLGLNITRSFSPLAAGALAYGRTRAVYGAFGGDVSRSEQSLSLSLTRRLSEDLSVRAGLAHQRAHGGQLAGKAHANSVSLSLSYDWPRLDAAR